MSREDSPGRQEPHPQPLWGTHPQAFARLGEDFEPVEVELVEPPQIGNG